MNFWKNPENNALKVLIFVVIFAAAGLFVFKYAHFNSLRGTGSVLGDPSTGIFQAAIDIPNAFNTDQFASGDFNEDGHIDLATTSPGGSTISVLFGDGTGGFSAPTTYAVGNSPKGILAADFGNGHIDLAVVNKDDDTVSILMGDGSGTFVPSTTPTLSVGTSPLYIAGGDFGNGHFDLAVSNATANSIAILYGDGTGAFVAGPTPFIGTQNNPQGIAVGDFSGDGNVDVAIATQFGIYIARGDGTGAFDGIPTQLHLVTGHQTQILQTADLNEDGRPDFLATNLAFGTVSIFLADGTGNFPLTPSATISIGAGGGTQQLGITTGDYGNGHVDVVTTDLSTGNISIFIGTGDGITFNPGTPLTMTTGSTTPEGAITADFNEDGLPDVAVGKLGNSQISLFLGNIAPIVSEITPVPTPDTNATPSYTFNATQAGTITYGGGCTSSTAVAVAGSNTIVFSSLAPGTYSSCTITVTSHMGSISNILTVSSFTITSGGTSGTTTTGTTTTTGGSTGGGGGGGGSILLAPSLTEVVPVATPSENRMPTYAFSSTESGNLVYGGGCSSDTVFAVNGLNTITFSPLPFSGTYSVCTIQLIDLAGTKSNVLVVSPFTITDPVVVPTPLPEPTPTPTPVPQPTPTPKPVPTPKPTPPPTPVPVPTPIVNPVPIPAPFPTPPPITPVQTPPPVETPVPTAPSPAPVLMDSNGCPVGTATGTFGQILDEIKSKFCVLWPMIGSKIDSVKSSYNTVHGDFIAKIVSLIAIAGTAVIVTTSGIFLGSLAAAEILLIPIRLLSLFLTGLGLKKRRKSWGTVYDSVTKAPLDPARVTLWNSAGKKVASTLTNLSGKFSFALPPAGTYVITAKKKGYLFPTKKLMGTSDEIYPTLYRGDTVTITAGGSVNINIPMDPENFDWKTFAETGPRSMKTDATVEKLLFGLCNILFPIGFVVSLIALVMTVDLYNAILFTAALIVLFIKSPSLCSRPFGYITDKKTGYPLSYGVVRLSSIDQSVDVADCVLDGVGKYSFRAPKGKYLVRIERKMPDGSYHIIAKGLTTKPRKGYLSMSYAASEPLW